MKPHKLITNREFKLLIKPEGLDRRSKVLELSQGKNSVEVSSPTELINAITVIKKAVEAGALDAQIESVSKSVRARFVK